MIEPMRKFTFVLHHLDYTDFLSNLQKLGTVHIIRHRDDKTDSQQQSLEAIGEYNESIKFLDKLKSTAPQQANTLAARTLLGKINQAREERETLARRLDVIRKQIRELSPWGHFDYDLVKQIRDQGLKVEFHTCLKNHFNPEWATQYALQIISEQNGLIYFVIVSDTGFTGIEADIFSFHRHTLQELETELSQTEEKVAALDEYLKDIAPTAREVFSNEIKRLTHEYDYEDATLQGIPEAENHIVILSGWIPVNLEKGLSNYLDAQNVVYFSEAPSPQDNPPVKLHNNWFARQFEPISKMYMLPAYTDMDLTPLFAPFYMVFFGFCNADMAYGVMFIVVGLLLRWKMKHNEFMSAIGNLGIIFGVSSIIMGWVMGSVLGYDLKLLPGVGDKVPIRNFDQIFNFALLLGAIQLIFGMIVAAIKKIRQSGFRSSIANFGTVLLVGSLTVYGAQQLGADISDIQPYLMYPMLSGLALILLFNSPGRNPIFNIFNGLWLLYGIITGFFGDILSYIRLFALCVSSAILGFVFNTIGEQIAGISYVGPVIFVLFMIFGHTLNFALGTLSGFVHSLRLTFVEFYKNAAFVGPGMAYKPFGNKE